MVPIPEGSEAHSEEYEFTDYGDVSGIKVESTASPLAHAVFC